MKKLFDEYNFPFFEYGNIDLSNVENVKNNINQRFYMLERSLLACSLQEQKIDDVIGELNDLASFVLYWFTFKPASDARETQLFK